MKTVFLWFRIIMGAAVTVLSAVFVSIEGIRLFIGDHLLYALPFPALLQIGLRFCLSAASLIFGVHVLRGRASVWSCICLLLCTVIPSPFLSNGFGVYFPLIAALTLCAVWGDQHRTKQQ